MTITKGSPVPITALTGFLGAGKTTLLNRILTSDHGRRIGVLVNDFGAVNVDEKLIVSKDDSTIALANGCVCCEIDDDLVAAVDSLVARDEAPDYIVLEASGVADPLGIAMTLGNQRIADRIHLDGIVSIVDCDAVFAHPEYPELIDLKLRQVGYSDIVLLNKVDLVDAEGLQRVHEWIDEKIPRVRTIETTFAEVPLEVLLGVGGSADASPPDNEGRHNAGTEFTSAVYESDHPIPLSVLAEEIKRFPRSVFRCKGIVFSDDDPDHEVVVQAVGRRATFSQGQPWGQRKPRSQLVIIGASQDLDPEALQGQLERAAHNP